MAVCSGASCDRPAAAPGVALRPAGPEIRVELARRATLLVGWDCDIDVRSIADGELVYRGRVSSPTEVSIIGAGITLGGVRLPSAVRIEPRTTNETLTQLAEAKGEVRAAVWPGDVPAPPLDAGGTSTFLLAPLASGRATVGRYRGALELWSADGEIVAVNALPLESYLLGVIGAEMPGEYPLEALRSQAIAARTYALYELDVARSRGRDLVVPSGPVFQVYRGVAAEHPRVTDAVNSTRGVVLTYQGRIFRAYFHSTCGGQTARANLAFGDVDIPPLEGRPCGACDDAPRARWESVITAAVVESALRERVAARAPGTRIGTVRGIEIAETGPDGRARYIRIDHDLGALEWRADIFRSRVASDAIHSTYFQIRPGEKDGEFVVSGRGWGHGVGLCQVGSAGLARENLDHEEILGRYYPQAELRRAW